jgi:hypothetical protein
VTSGNDPDILPLMDKNRRRIVGATAVSAAAMASMLGIAAPAQADPAATTTGPPAAQGALLKVENAMLKLDGVFLKTPVVDNAFLKIQSILLKFNGNPT